MKRILPYILLVGILIAFRVMGSFFPENLPNFQPLSAVFFCGALLAPGWRGFAIPLAAWAVTFPLGVGHTANPLDFASTILGLTLVFFLGKALNQRRLPTLLLGSVAAAIVFHLITNGGAWLASSLYAKNLEGLYQSVWSGPAGSTLPSWVFLRNMAAANFLFTSILLLSQVRFPNLRFATPTPAFAKVR